MENQTPVLSVDLAEAARLSSLSRRTLEGYIASKELKAVKVGRRRIISIRELEKFLRRNHPSPTPNGRTEAASL